MDRLAFSHDFGPGKQVAGIEELEQAVRHPSALQEYQTDPAFRALVDVIVGQAKEHATRISEPALLDFRIEMMAVLQSFQASVRHMNRDLARQLVEAKACVGLALEDEEDWMAKQEPGN